MPELPEVEVTRRGIGPPLRGATVRSLRLGKPLRWPLGVGPLALVGARVGDALRRGKYIWLPLATARHPDGGLLLHLGMSGALRLLPQAPPPGPHDHFDLVTDRGTLRLTDPRRFGAAIWSPAIDQPPAAPLLARLGVEPLADAGFDAAELRQALQGRRTPIKQLLLSGEVVVGAGNIYACEALFQAGIHPATPARRVGPERAARLLQALRDTLQRALAAGGSTLRDFSDAHGMAGAYQRQAAVYGREGQPCTRCGAPVRRSVMAQRSTYFCPRCQRG